MIGRRSEILILSHFVQSGLWAGMGGETANGMYVLNTYRGPAASVGQALSMGSGWVDVPGEPAKGRVASLVGGVLELQGFCLLVSLRFAFSSLYFCFVLLSSPFPKMLLLLLLLLP